MKFIGGVLLVGLLGVQAQAELLQPFPEFVQEPLGLVTVPENPGRSRPGTGRNVPRQCPAVEEAQTEGEGREGKGRRRRRLSASQATEQLTMRTVVPRSAFLFLLRR